MVHWYPRYAWNKFMRNELLSWLAREGLLLQGVVSSSEDPEHDEVKVSIKAPVVALSRTHDDFRECPDPALFGYPESCLDMMNLEDFHQFVYQWFERAVEAGMGRGFVCNKVLGSEKPWDAGFVTPGVSCWVRWHFGCIRRPQLDLK